VLGAETNGPTARWRNSRPVANSYPLQLRAHYGNALWQFSRLTFDFAQRAWHLAPALRRCLHGRFAVANALTRLLPNFTSGVVRGPLYRWAGFRIGEGAYIMGNLHLTSSESGFYDKLTIGASNIIADNVTINLDASVILGRNVAIGPRVAIYTGSHRIGPGSMRLGALVCQSVIIEDGAWVRLGAVIAPGVTIGRGSIVATGAVVLKDVPPNTYVEGNPARVVRRLPWGDR
jgi:acetyltransferase-like isoleucine patch superfamily enzyme